MALAIEDAAHVFLHINLCAAVARAAVRAPVPIHVKLTDRVGGVEFERTVRVSRDDATQAVVEFDVHRGIYRLRIDAPGSRCSTSDYLDFLPDRSRTITETLTAGPPGPPDPVDLLDGTAPLSFLYVKPTFAFFAPGLACNAAVTAPLTVRSTVEYDQSAFHVSLYPDGLASMPSPVPSGSTTLAPIVVALRLRTPTGLAHYVRVPIPFPTPWTGWPRHIQFNVSEEMISGLATEKTDTLLCLKLWQTTVR